MGQDVSSPVVEQESNNGINEKKNNEKNEPRCEAFEVVKLERSPTMETVSSVSTLGSPPAHHLPLPKFGTISPIRSSGSVSSLDSESLSSTTCQSPVARSPESLPPFHDRDLTLAVQKAKEALEKPHQTRPTPPPSPPPPPPPQVKHDFLMPDFTQLPQCGELMSLVDLGDTVSEYLDPSKYDATAIFDPTKFDPMSYWWETDEEPTQGSKSPPPMLTQRDLVLQEAASLELRGDLMSALECYKECLSMGKSMVHTAQVHHKMGVLHWKIGNYEESLRVLQKCMRLYQDAFGFMDVDQEEWIVDEASGKASSLAEVLNSLGRVHLSLEHFPEASRDLKQALALVKLAHHQSSNDDEQQQEALACCLARTKFGLGMVQEAKGKTERAMKYYSEALEVHRAHDAAIDVASCLNSIGAIHEQSTKYDHAMDCYTEALMIYRAQLVEGRCSPVDVAVTLNNIGFIHHLWGEFHCSMTAYQDALGIMESVLGPQHRNVASTRHNIGLVHVERGNYEDALSLFKQVLKTQLEILGQAHTDVAITLDSISNAYENLGKLERAIKYLERSLLIRERVLGRKHLLVAVTLDRLGKVEMKHNDLIGAKRRLLDAMRIYEANNVPTNDGRILSVKECLTMIRKQTNERIEEGGLLVESL